MYIQITKDSGSSRMALTNALFLKVFQLLKIQNFPVYNKITIKYASIERWETIWTCRHKAQIGNPPSMAINALCLGLYQNLNENKWYQKFNKE